MNLTVSRSRPQNRPSDRPPPNLSEERLKALSADMRQAFAQIARRRF